MNLCLQTTLFISLRSVDEGVFVGDKESVPSGGDVEGESPPPECYTRIFRFARLNPEQLLQQNNSQKYKSGSACPLHGKII